MAGLCSDSSRSYPGRPARQAPGRATGAGLRPGAKAPEKPPDPTALPGAPTGAIPGGSRQESAEGIVPRAPSGEGPNLKGGNDPAVIPALR
jgi:hypothetical protein